MPIRHRHWFMNRLVRHFEEKKNAIEGANSQTSNSDNQSKLDKFDVFQNQINNKFS